MQSHEHICGKLDQVLDKIDRLNAQVEVLPEILRKILDLYMEPVEEPAPTAPAEPSEEEKARDAIVAARVKDLGEQIRGWLPSHPSKLTWTQLIHVLVWEELSGTRVWCNGFVATAGHEQAFISSAALRAKDISVKIQKVTSEDICKFMGSQTK